MWRHTHFQLLARRSVSLLSRRGRLKLSLKHQGFVWSLFLYFRFSVEKFWPQLSHQKGCWNYLYENNFIILNQICPLLSQQNPRLIPKDRVYPFRNKRKKQHFPVCCSLHTTGWAAQTSPGISKASRTIVTRVPDLTFRSKWKCTHRRPWVAWIPLFTFTNLVFALHEEWNPILTHNKMQHFKSYSVCN